MPDFALRQNKYRWFLVSDVRWTRRTEDGYLHGIPTSAPSRPSDVLMTRCTDPHSRVQSKRAHVIATHVFALALSRWCRRSGLHMLVLAPQSTPLPIKRHAPTRYAARNAAWKLTMLMMPFPKPPPIKVGEQSHFDCRLFPSMFDPGP